MFSLVLSCLAAAAAAGFAIPAAAVAAAYLPPTELRAPPGEHAAVVAGRAAGVTTALNPRGQHSPCLA